MLQSLHIQFIPLTTFTTCSRRGQIGGLIFSADWKLRVDHQIVRSNQNICSLNCVVTTCVKYAYEGFISTNIPPTTEFNVRDQEIRLMEKDERNEDETVRAELASASLE